MAVGLPLKTTYADGDVYSASDVNDTNGTINLTAAPYAAGKNALINGGMDIWQRGTSSNSTGYQTVDRWFGNWTGTATYSQETTTVPTGSRYALKMDATATAALYANQAIETSNAVRFVGQNVTFSIYAQGSTSIPMSLVVYYSTNVDQPLTSSWTTITPTSGGTGTAVSGSFTRISGVWAIPSTAKSIMVQFNTTSTIASGAYVIVGQTQLEQGSTATAFQTATGTIEGELAACQRYYYRNANGSTYNTYGVGISVSSSQSSISVPLPVTMRVAPTSVDYSTLGITDAVNYQLALSALTMPYASPSSVSLQANTAASQTALRTALLTNQNSTAGYLGFSAEL